MKNVFGSLMIVALLFLFFPEVASAQTFDPNSEEVSFFQEGESNSDTIKASGWKLASIIFPDGFDGNEFVVYTASNLDSPFVPVYYNGSMVKENYVEDALIGFSAAAVNQLLDYFFIKSQTSGTAEIQSRKRYFKFILTRF